MRPMSEYEQQKRIEHFKTFLATKCAIEPTASIRPAELFAEYEIWMRSNRLYGFVRLKKNAFEAAVRQEVPGAKIRGHGLDPMWVGVGLK